MSQRERERERERGPRLNKSKEEQVPKRVALVGSQRGKSQLEVTSVNDTCRVRPMANDINQHKNSIYGRQFLLFFLLLAYLHFTILTNEMTRPKEKVHLPNWSYVTDGCCCHQQLKKKNEEESRSIAENAKQKFVKEFRGKFEEFWGNSEKVSTNSTRHNCANSFLKVTNEFQCIIKPQNRQRISTRILHNNLIN